MYRILKLVVVVFFGFSLYVSAGDTSFIIEMATLGTTGHTSGTSISRHQFIGMSFSIFQPVQVTAIGGHLVASPGSTIFGAIVPVPAPEAVPAVAPLEIESVALASTVFNPSTPSSDFRTPLSVFLPVGDYALIFGTGLFGASHGAAVVNLAEAGGVPILFTGFTTDNLNVSGFPLGRWNCCGFSWRLVVEGEFVAVQAVSIDIKPGSDPNCFNNNMRGVIPVAILSSAEFDATQVDTSTVRLTGLEVKVAGKSNKFLAHFEDVNGDGFFDLVVQIEDTDQVFTPGTTTATLTGALYDGTLIEGEDDICIVP